MLDAAAVSGDAPRVQSFDCTMVALTALVSGAAMEFSVYMKTAVVVDLCVCWFGCIFHCEPGPVPGCRYARTLHCSKAKPFEK